MIKIILLFLIFYLGFGILVISIHIKDTTKIDTWKNFSNNFKIIELITWPRILFLWMQ
jgi:hypothetical protein